MGMPPPDPKDETLLTTVEKLADMVDSLTSAVGALAERYEQLADRYQRLKHAYQDLDLRHTKLTTRFNKYYPEMLNCTRCGRKIQRNMARCRFCSHPTDFDDAA